MRFCRHSELLLSLILLPLCLRTALMLLLAEHRSLKRLSFSIGVVVSVVRIILACPQQPLSAHSFNVLPSFSPLHRLLHQLLGLAARIRFHLLGCDGIIRLAQRKVLAAEVDLLELSAILCWCYGTVALSRRLDALWEFCLRIAERRTRMSVDRHSLYPCCSIALYVLAGHASV